MKLLFTKQALESFEEALTFISNDVSYNKLMEIRNSVLQAAEMLIENPFIGQKEIYLEHMGLDHRRIIEGNFKIIYRVIDQVIYITDIFDTRQKPDEMKG